MRVEDLEQETRNMKRDELAALRLRELFERRGFRRVSVGKFEDYSLYVENKNFLNAECVITFMDMDGKLLALKPDVTLSVVKGIQKKPLPTFEKLYYQDEVYRVSRESREYRARSQIGVELLGKVDVFAGIEVLDLALESLAVIGSRYLLDISHLGFVQGLLQEIGLSQTEQSRILSAIHAKNAHDLASVLENAGVDERHKGQVVKLARLHGNLGVTLQEVKALVSGREMKEAYDELRAVSEALDRLGHGANVNLDFSVVNDLDYYNGLIFLGYVQGMPRVALTGGRYDNLMRKMGKESGAIGFAVSLDDLGTHFKGGRSYDFDTLVVYDDDCDFAALLGGAKELAEMGISVRLERYDADISAAGFTYRRLLRFSGGKFIAEDGESQC